MIVLYLLITALLLLAFLMRPHRRHPLWSKLEGLRYAHRGLHDVEAGIPENSMPAVQAALDKGFAIELDVHLLADGSLAVFHDNDLKRVCGADVPVKELTAQRLKDYPLLGGNGAYIPLFEEVLALVSDRIPLLIELKVEDNNEAALTDAVMAALKDWNGVYIIQSFSTEAITYLRKCYPGVPRGLLCTYFMRNRDRESPWRAWYVLKYWLMCTVHARPDFISHMWKDPSAHYLRQRCRKQGIRTFCWTIRDSQTMLDLEQQGSAVIFEGFVPEG